MSKLSFPDIGEHSYYWRNKEVPPKLIRSYGLKAWGYRLGTLKGDYGENENAWDKISQDMVEYCRQDVEVTYQLYTYLKGRFSEQALQIEQEFARVIGRQERYGAFIDVQKARQLHIELVKELEIVEESIQKSFPPLSSWKSVPYPKKPYKKDGSESNALAKQIAKGCHYDENNVWGYYEYIDFNPSSRQMVARWLQEVYGWEPSEFTEKGGVKVSEEILKGLNIPEGQLLADYFKINKVLSHIITGDTSIMSLIDSDGRVRGSVDTLGAITRRCKHSRPNMANLPSTRAYKGKEVRSLIIAPKGKKIIGCDADGLELRMLAHYLYKYDNGKYAHIVDKGDKDKGTDIHTMNMKSAGLSSRDNAKTFIYGFLYGAGAGKLGEIVGGGFVEGTKLKEKFLKEVPAIKKLLNEVEKTIEETGYLLSLDKNRYSIRSSHAGLNVLLQGAGALVMKYYLVFLDKRLSKEFITGKQYEFILNVHDEVQIEVDEDIVDRVKFLCEDTFSLVTKYLKFKIPLRGTASVGTSWADTH